ncbi:MAG: hypothetical protein NVS1B10_02220 [Candidatus Saccharimonadales bacterium]
MSNKANKINEHQISLIQQVGSDEIAATHIPNDPAEKMLGYRPEPVVTYGPRGSYVDIAEGSKHMKDALTALGKSNQRIGFGVASNARQYNGPIFGRYRGRTRAVQEGAEDNINRYIEDAKQSFWQATGFTALRKTGIFSDELISARAKHMWKEFSTEYGVIGKPEKRTAYKAQLNKSITASKSIIRKMKKVDDTSTEEVRKKVVSVQQARHGRIAKKSYGLVDRISNDPRIKNLSTDIRIK